MKSFFRFIFTYFSKALSYFLIALVYVYKYIVSPVLPRACRFYPTCSQYAIVAIKRHGIIKGTFLSAYRVIRCNPFCSGGYDPVPKK